MNPLDRALDTDTLVLKNGVGIMDGADDPSSVGVVAPLGTLYLRTNGDTYHKTGSGDTAWASLVGTGSGRDVMDFRMADDSQNNIEGAGRFFPVFMASGNGLNLIAPESGKLPYYDAANNQDNITWSSA